MNEKNLLITGFDPFGGERVNPSYEAVKLLPERIGNINIIKRELPTEFFRASEFLRREIEAENPDFVIMVGQAGGRGGITPERVAINCMDAAIPDNGGEEPHDEVIYNDGPAAYFSSLPIKNMVSAIKEAGISAAVSNTAGTYVCNRVMYEALHISAKRAKTDGKTFPAGFIHVPYIPSQTVGRENVPSMELEAIVRGLQAAISVLTE